MPWLLSSPNCGPPAVGQPGTTFQCRDVEVPQASPERVAQKRAWLRYLERVREPIRRAVVIPRRRAGESPVSGGAGPLPSVGVLEPYDIFAPAGTSGGAFHERHVINRRD